MASEADGTGDRGPSDDVHSEARPGDRSAQPSGHGGEDCARSAPDDGLEAMLEMLRACRGDLDVANLAPLVDKLRSMARRHLPAGSGLRRGFDSEDLAQEGLLQLLANLDRFRGTTVAELLAFAKAIVGQQAARQARWQRVRNPELRGGADAADHAEEDRTPSTDAMAAEDKQRLLELVEGLAEPYRSTLRMRLEGKTNLEIAAELGLREELVRKRLSRALKDLHGRW